MKRALHASIALTLVGAGCLVAFNVIGSTIDDEGFLQEPFYLAGIGALSLLAGTLGVAVTGVILLVRTRRSSR